MNVAIVDLGLNNMSSLKRAINKSVTDVVQLDLNEVGFSRNIDIVVLPGVGHFGAASRALDEKNLRKNILDLHQENVPILGICLGLHLFFETSEESRQHKGLGLIAGEVKKLRPNDGSPVPNVGWCETQFNQEHILGDLNGDYYFTHSYYPVLRDQKSVFSTSLHGNNPITSGVVSDGIVGLQFHPEKSGEVGNRLLSSLLYGLASNRKPISL